MIRRVLFLFSALIAITSSGAEGKMNVLLICVDDLRPELKCYGVDYIHSPNIDALAAGGRIFTRHYVQAPTCGASRFTLLTGKYGGSNNDALFHRSKALVAKPESVDPSMPAWFKDRGYTTVSVGKVSHHPGGLGGPDWNDPSLPEMPNSWDRNLLPFGPWQHPRGWMHGLANGEIRVKAGEMDLFQAVEGPDTIYPDGAAVDLTLEELEALGKGAPEKPFFLATGILRPHLPFGAPAGYLELYNDVELPATPHPTKPEGKTTWHKSGEFMKYNRWGKDPNTDPAFALEVRRHYAACVSYADAQVGRIIAKLDALGLRESTVIVLWGDHGWHLGEHAIWGKHALFEESLRSPLIISHPGIAEPGAATSGIVETLDLFPTLTDLTGLETPSFTQGRSLRPLLENPEAEGGEAHSYSKNIRTIRTDRYRLIAHQGGHYELYDEVGPDGETRNIAAQNPAVVEALAAKIEARFAAD
ncbi:sulfatase [Verrucomicrobiales bacterium BCK34]|nr:sulfatase [Verrucomicrobiales bacterium BCK34]